VRTRTVYLTLAAIVLAGVAFWFVYRNQFVRIG